MSPDVSERAFEDAIECGLLQHGPDLPAEASAKAGAGDATAVRETPPPYGETPPGGYRQRRLEDYDRALCLLPRDVVDFVLATQPKEWQKLAQHHGAAVREQFLKRLAAEIERRGALDVLRSGIKDSGCKFRLAYFRPASGLNEETRRLHAANIFSVVRQVHYSAKNDPPSPSGLRRAGILDLVLFLNGIPIVTAELKNPLNGQDVEDAIRQYKTGRDPRESLLAYGRCLGHFAVDPDLVYVATHLAGPKTRFLPFNQGKFEQEQQDFRGQLTDYVRLYAFLAQVLPSPTLTSRSSMSSRGTCAGCCPPIGRRCRARSSRISTWSPTESS
jgi:type I site-specific restriction-modification system R (restriction) subunit